MSQNAGLHPQQPWQTSELDPHAIPVNQHMAPWGQTAAGVGAEELTIPYRHHQIAHSNHLHLQKLHVTAAFDTGIRRLEDIASTVGGSYRGVRR